MKSILLSLCLLVPALAFADHSRFSNWMAMSDIKSYIDINKAAKFPAGNYMIHAIQGRYINGQNEYRVVLTEKPDYVSRWWWWYSQDLASFTAKVAEYQNKGANLAWAQSFTGASGKVYYQAVWIDYQ
jgi:hypothetical protein